MAQARMHARAGERDANRCVPCTRLRHGQSRFDLPCPAAPPSATPRSAIVLTHCKYIRLRGDNDPTLRYGIEIARAGGKNLTEKEEAC